MSRPKNIPAIDLMMSLPTTAIVRSMISPLATIVASVRTMAVMLFLKTFAPVRSGTGTR